MWMPVAKDRMRWKEKETEHQEQVRKVLKFIEMVLIATSDGVVYGTIRVADI